MLLAGIAVLAGLGLLIWSADRFVEGAAATARHLGMPAILIGMVVIGFGTSAPEMVVSAISALQGNPGLALGNAYGSNIANIGLIIGITALLSPITVHSQVLRKELPLLVAITILAAWQIWDGFLSRENAVLLLVVFFLLMLWSIIAGMRASHDPLANEMEEEITRSSLSLGQAMGWLVAGLLLLILSSRLLVWGSVVIAQNLGVSDLVIGLTIVAVGTSLPELASSIAAIRKHEHDLALGNILGSNLFNTLAVVGIAGVIHPLEVPAEIFTRDLPVVGVLTLLLFAMCFGFRGPGRVNRIEGGILLGLYVAYTGYLVTTVLA